MGPALCDAAALCEAFRVLYYAPAQMRPSAYATPSTASPYGSWLGSSARTHRASSPPSSARSVSAREAPRRRIARELRAFKYPRAPCSLRLTTEVRQIYAACLPYVGRCEKQGGRRRSIRAALFALGPILSWRSAASPPGADLLFLQYYVLLLLLRSNSYPRSRSLTR